MVITWTSRITIVSDLMFRHVELLRNQETVA